MKTKSSEKNALPPDTADDKARIEELLLRIARLESENEALKKINELKFDSKTDYAALISRAEDGIIVGVNKKFEEITGYTQADTVNKTTVDIGLINPLVRHKILEKLSADNQIDDFIVSFKTKSGSKINLKISLEKISIAGKTHLMSKMLADTSEDMHEPDNALFKKMIDMSESAMFVTDENFTLTYVNRAHEKLYKRSLEEGQTIGVLDYFTPRCAKRVMEEIFPALIAGKPVGTELECIDAEGHIFPVFEFITPIIGSDGNLKGVFGTLKSIEFEIQKLGELESANGKLKSMFDGSLQGMLIVGRDKRIIEANPAFLEFSGYDYSELIGKYPSEISDENGGKTCFELFDSMLAGEISHFTIKVNYIKKSGQPAIAIQSVTAVRNPGGEIEFAIFSISDNTGYEAAQQALIEKSEEFRMIFDLNPSPIWYKDTANRYIKVNRAAADLFGLPAGAIEGKHASELHPKEYMRFYEEDMLVVSTGKAVIGIESGFTDGKGDACLLSVNKVPVFRPDGSIYRICELAENITEKRAAEEVMRSLSAELQLIFHSIPAAVWYKDTANRIIRANRTAAEFAGLPLESILGQRTEDVFPLEAEKFFTDDLEVINDCRPKYNIIEKITSAGGVERIVATTKLPIVNAFGEIDGLVVFSIDVTEGKKFEEALQKSEKRFREFMDRLPQTVFESDIDGMLTYTNQAGKEEFGYDESLIKTGICIFDLIDNETHDNLRKRFFELTERQNRSSSEYVFMRADGSAFPGAVFSAPIIENGRTVGLRGVVANITELKSALEALNESSQYFGAVFENSGIGMSIHYTDGRYYRVNDSMCEMLGYTKEELLKISVYEITHQDDIETNRQGISALVSGKTDLLRYEKRFIKADGEVMHAKAIVSAVKNQKGETMFIAAQIEDISDMRNALNALMESEEKYRSLVNRLPVGVYRTTPDGKVLFSNTAMAKMLGYDNDDLHKINVIDTYSDPIERNRYLERFITRKNDIAQEIKVKKSDGEEIILHDIGHPVFDGNGNLLYIDGTLENITERLHNEKSVRDSELRFRMMFEKSPMGYQSLDYEGRLIDVNPAWTEMSGYELTDITGKKFSELLTAEFSAKFENDLKKSFSAGDVYNFEGEMIKNDGSIITVSFTGKTAYSNSYKFECMHCIISDITSQKEAERKIIELKNFYESIVENINDGIFAVNENNQYTYVNSAYEKITLIEREKLIGTNFIELFRGHITSEFERKYFEAVESRKTLDFDEDFYVVNKDFHEYFDGRIVPLPGGETIVTMHDITQSKRQSVILDKRNKILQSVAAAAETLLKNDDFDFALNNLINMLGPVSGADRVYVYTSDEYTGEFVPKIEWLRLGFKSRKMSQSGFSDFLKARSDSPVIYGKIDDFNEADRALLGRKGVKSILLSEIKVFNEPWGYIGFDDCTKSREWFPAEIDTIRTASFIIEGAAERQKAEQALKLSEQKLLEAVKSKDKFLNIIAHDLRGPFGGFIGLAQILSNDIADMSIKDISAISNEMHKTSLRLFALLENLLEWSRTQTGRMDFNPQLVDLRYLAISKVNLFKTSAEKKRIVLKSLIDEDVHICADMHMLRTVLRNLINNAIKFTPEPEEDSDCPVISISAEDKGDFVEISVSDQGYGMSEEDTAKLFRIDVSHISINSGPEKGTGLGLILCKEFVELHGGNISCTSERGRGSKFTFSMPKSINSIPKKNLTDEDD